MTTKETTMGERELEPNRGWVNKNSLLIIAAVIVAAGALFLASSCSSQRPVITSLEAEAEWTVPLGNLQVTCTASDPDGDQLSYSWSASGGEINGEGATVTWTAPASEGSYTVAVTVTDGHGGEATKQLTMTVGANRAPYINSLVADADWTTPSGSLQVMCNATDPDGDELAYEWTATGGIISGTGAAVNWTTPQEVGMYNVTVVVRDGYGATDATFVSLSVVTGNPPTVEKLTVTAKEPKYLKQTSTGYKVGKTKEYYIECTASNTSGELVYEWSCDGGAIFGEGSSITWTAPDTEGDVTVTVVVTDVADNAVSKSIVLNVVPCSACLFG